MFVSFFPTPRLFFLSVMAWIAIVTAVWYLGGGSEWGATLGISYLPPDAAPVVGLGYFVTGQILWFYCYFALAVALFAAPWMTLAPHRWQLWSILGSAFILFTTYFQVQVSVAINNWYGPFYDLVQAAVSKSRPVSLAEFYAEMFDIAGVLMVAVIVGVLTRFFVSHYIFRWRTAMNDFYTAHWPKLRHIEGASQRVQEDTMRFSTIVEGLGVSLIDSVMTLIAFLPVLVRLSAPVSEVPLLGAIPHPLVVIAVLWAIFGTGFLALVGVKLPGLQFRNQRVEAAYRKELVYGEDDETRAQPRTLAELFSWVRHNYFRLYFHYAYFNVARISFLQIDNIFPYIVLAPTIVAGKITLGPLQQILSAFEQVRSSFQYLINSWTIIVELMSVQKRLRAFEAVIYGESLPSEDKEIPEAEVTAEGVRT